MKVITFDYWSNCRCLWNFISNENSLRPHTYILFFYSAEGHNNNNNNINMNVNKCPHTGCGALLQPSRRTAAITADPRTFTEMDTHNTKQMILINILSATTRPLLLPLSYTRRAEQREGGSRVPRGPPTHARLTHRGEARRGRGRIGWERKCWNKYQKKKRWNRDQKETKKKILNQISENEEKESI